MKADITIKEALDAKSKFEVEINKLLYDFEHETGLRIEEISFVRRPVETELGVEIDMVYCTEAKVMI